MNSDYNQGQVRQELTEIIQALSKKALLSARRQDESSMEGCSIIGHERFLTFSCDVPKYTVLVTVRERILDYMDH